MDALIYKIARPDEWHTMQETGVYPGAPVDIADGYIHFSTRMQLQETADRHFAGAKTLFLLEVGTTALNNTLKWEPSRGGALFPHLYGQLLLHNVLQAWEVKENKDGQHDFSFITDENQIGSPNPIFTKRGR